MNAGQARVVVASIRKSLAELRRIESLPRHVSVGERTAQRAEQFGVLEGVATDIERDTAVVPALRVHAITINGRERKVGPAADLLYETIVAMAYVDDRSISASASVVAHYPRDSEYKDRIVTPGQSIPLADGLSITAVDTGNA